MLSAHIQICLIRSLSKTLCISFYIKLCDLLTIAVANFSFSCKLSLVVHFFFEISIHPTIVGAGDTIKNLMQFGMQYGRGRNPVQWIVN